MKKSEINQLIEDIQQRQNVLRKGSKNKQHCVQCEFEKKLTLKIAHNDITPSNKNLKSITEIQKFAKPPTPSNENQKHVNLNELKYKYLYSQLYQSFEKKKESRQTNYSFKSSKQQLTTKDASFEVGQSFSKKQESMYSIQSIFQSKSSSPYKSTLNFSIQQNSSKQNPESKLQPIKQTVNLQDKITNQHFSSNQQLLQQYQLTPENVSYTQLESNSSFDFLLNMGQQNQNETQQNQQTEVQTLSIRDLNESMKSADISQEIRQSQQILNLQESIRNFQKQIEQIQQQKPNQSISKDSATNKEVKDQSQFQEKIQSDRSFNLKANTYSSQVIQSNKQIIPKLEEKQEHYQQQFEQAQEQKKLKGNIQLTEEKQNNQKKTMQIEVNRENQQKNQSSPNKEVEDSFWNFSNVEDNQKVQNIQDHELCVLSDQNEIEENLSSSNNKKIKLEQSPQNFKSKEKIKVNQAQIVKLVGVIQKISLAFSFAIFKKKITSINLQISKMNELRNHIKGLVKVIEKFYLSKLLTKIKTFQPPKKDENRKEKQMTELQKSEERLGEQNTGKKQRKLSNEQQMYLTQLAQQEQSQKNNQSLSPKINHDTQQTVSSQRKKEFKISEESLQKETPHFPDQKNLNHLTQSIQCVFLKTKLQVIKTLKLMVENEKKREILTQQKQK